MSGKIRTIEDLYRAYYNRAPYPAGFLISRFRYLLKQDNPITTADAALVNPRYGAVVDTFLNYEVDAWKLFPKKPYNQAGFRIEVGRPANLVTGVGENSALPDTIKGTFSEEEILPKIMMTHWEITEHMKIRSELSDGIPQLEQFFREKNQEYFVKGMNQKLLEDAEAAAATATANTAEAAGDDIESIDRIISSDSEEDAFGGTYSGWYDAYGTWDRDTGTTYDTVVLHNSGNDRALTLSLVDDLIRQCRDAGAKKENQFFLTDSQTFMEWSALIDAKYRITEVDVSITMNGVRTETGAREAVARVPVYDGRPVFISEDVPADGSGRIYLIDQSSLYIKVYTPVQYLSTNRQHFLLVDALKDLHAYIWVGQVWCTAPTRQGKLRDLA